MGDAQILRLPLADLSRCDCDPNKPDPCSSDEHCLNRMLKYECHPHVCAAGKSKTSKLLFTNRYVQLLFFLIKCIISLKQIKQVRSIRGN